MDVAWQPEMANEIELRAGTTAASVAPARGGLVTAFRIGAREVLFLDRATLTDPTANVRGGIPLLFPNAGPLAGGRFADKGTALPQHGFARRHPWQVVEQAADRLVMRLPDAPEIQAQYPYRFALTATVAVTERRLRFSLTVANQGNEPLPIAPGWHPYLAVPHAAKGRITSRFLGPLWSRITDDAEFVFAVPFDDPCDLTLPPDGLRLALTASPEVRVLQQWSLPGQDFVCFEPFLGPNDALNHPGQRRNLPPGAAQTLWMEIAVAG